MMLKIRVELELMTEKTVKPCIGAYLTLEYVAGGGWPFQNGVRRSARREILDTGKYADQARIRSDRRSDALTAVESESDERASVIDDGSVNK
jgi:hypothetical protein